jgi:hypothetical protein
MDVNDFCVTLIKSSRPFDYKQIGSQAKMQTEQKETIATHVTNSTSEESVTPVDVSQLEHTFKLLTNWNLGLLIVAGVIGLAIGVLSVAIDRKGGQLLNAKDTQLAVTIATVKGDAAKESTRIEGEAKERIIKVETESSQKIAGLETAAAQAKADTAKAKQDLAALTATNLTLATKLAATEKASFPRNFNQDAVARELVQFKGTIVSVETISDFEARRTALLLASALDMAHWKVSSVNTLMDAPVADFFFSGISVEVGWSILPSIGTVPQAEIEREIEATKMAKMAALALIAQLQKNGIDASLTAARKDVPANTLRIRVSLKPMPGEPKGSLIIREASN